MKWISQEKVMCYADEYIVIKSLADKSVLFTGIIKNLQFSFIFAMDNTKENNKVECTLPGIAECCYYPLHILGSADEECGSQYNRTYEDSLSNHPADFLSQHTFSFEKMNGEILFTGRLLKVAPRNWFDTTVGMRRQRPPYDLLAHEKTQGIGYAENIYLNPIKQLIVAGIEDNADIKPTCDFEAWYYVLEEHILIGRLLYPDGRLIVVEDSAIDTFWQRRKLIRPGVIVKDYVEINGEKVWYVAEYSSSSNDGKAEAKVVFPVNFPEGDLVRFEGSFIRKSIPIDEKKRGRNFGYLAYYQVKGKIYTTDLSGEEIIESIDIYSDETIVEKSVLAAHKKEVLELARNQFRKINSKNDSAPTNLIGLEDLVGMAKVKQTFEELRKFGEYKQRVNSSLEKEEGVADKLRSLYNQKTLKNKKDCGNHDRVSLHMVFLGSPGTGKTTVAERIALLLKEFGLVVTNEIPTVVVRSDLVGRYIGHTEEVVKRKIKEAMGGILFVDEAYSLFEPHSNNDFGKIALNEIMYAMEQYRDELVVVLAGYTEEMLHMLKNANPGLTSRIPWYFYLTITLQRSFGKFCAKRLRKMGTHLILAPLDLSNPKHWLIWKCLRRNWMG